MRRVSVFVIAIFLACPTFAANESREQKRLAACGQVFKEILDIPDGIPKDLLNKAECVIVIPSVLKFAIGIGGDFGRGAITCRTGQHFTGHWSAPALFALEGANIGFQLGGQATDFVLLVMNPKGANSILSSKVKLGADASAAIGPKGRAAAADTDIVMRAEVLSYSRSRGLFAGISLEGSTLRSDGSANKKLYGRSLSAKEIVREGKVGVPASGRELISLLDKRSPKNESDPVSRRPNIAPELDRRHGKHSSYARQGLSHRDIRQTFLGACSYDAPNRELDVSPLLSKRYALELAVSLIGQVSCPATRAYATSKRDADTERVKAAGSVCLESLFPFVP